MNDAQKGKGQMAILLLLCICSTLCGFVFPGINLSDPNKKDKRPSYLMMVFCGILPCLLIVYLLWKFSKNAPPVAPS